MRGRLLGRLLALHLALFSSPLLPGWAALAAENSGTRLVALCTGNGLRLVEVPASETRGPAHGDEQPSPRVACPACLLGKCVSPGSSAVPITVLWIDAVTPTADAADIADEAPPETSPLERGPPSRAPPVDV